jgi:endonuclease YncB( thermonuclease family)
MTSAGAGVRLTLFALLLWLPSAAAPAATPIDAFVLQVIDGDTIDVVPTGDGDERRIRLAGIDAPERAQPGGAEATRALSRAILNRRVRLRVEDEDAYGRLVARVFVEGADVNLGLVAAGHAWAYRQYTSDEALIGAEADAKAARRGLWAAADPIPPWAWRAGERRARMEREAPTATGRCGSKRTCGQMGSCAEARFFLEQCGLTRLDGDGDGVPCESLCRR